MWNSSSSHIAHPRPAPHPAPHHERERNGPGDRRRGTNEGNDNYRPYKELLAYRPARQYICVR